jgi:4-aminobutyrate aminotransferase
MLSSGPLLARSDRKAASLGPYATYSGAISMSASASIIERCQQWEGGGLRTLVENEAIVLREGSGVWLEDVNGKRYLDLSSLYSVAVTGHCHPRVVQAVREQAGKLMHAPSSYPTRVRAEFLEAVASIIPKGLDGIIPAITGAMANEIAVQIARTRRPAGQIICFSGGYFGRTPGAVSFAGKSAFRESLGVTAGGQFLPYPYELRMGGNAAEEVLDLLDHLSGPGGGIGEIAAVLLEPVLGNGGVVIPPPSFLQGLRRFCDRTGALLIADEIQSGCGRCGTMWASQLSDVSPDLMTIGKGIGGGMAMAAVVGKKEHMNWRSDTFTSTFLTNTVNMAAAIASISVIRDEDLPSAASILGGEVHERLHHELSQTSLVAEVRSIGLWHGIELSDRDGKPNSGAAKAIARMLAHRGVIVGVGGYANNVIKLQPPLVISKSDLSVGVDAVIETILSFAAHPAGREPSGERQTQS